MLIKGKRWFVNIQFYQQDRLKQYDKYKADLKEDTGASVEEEELQKV